MVAIVLIIAFIVFVEAARRKIPVSYAKRHVGRQLVGGQQTTMPLKINIGGVIPVIFASSVLSMPQSLFAAFPPDPANPNTAWGKVWTFFQTFHASDPYYELIFLSLIIFFTFFYVSIVFNVEEVADNLRKHGGFMPGIRPGSSNRGILEQYPDEVDRRRRDLSGAGRLCSSVYAERIQSGATAFDWHLARLRGLAVPWPLVDSYRHGLSVLLWRHFVADSGRCGHGYGFPD